MNEPMHILANFLTDKKPSMQDGIVKEPSHATVPLKVPYKQYDALIVANVQEVEYQKEYEMYLRKRLWK